MFKKAGKYPLNVISMLIFPIQNGIAIFQIFNFDNQPPQILKIYHLNITQLQK